MATVILSTVGSIVGGPIGGAIGAAIGQQIDRSILISGTTREGPRIKELDLQTSSYGTQIPSIFGAMRVAGTVIWSTDLIERRTRTGGGKSRPSAINYSYSASFAVALSSRPIGRIGRIWADGNLLRGAAGDFKSETEFRFYSGHGDQPLDPLLSSAEATGQCPAYRGLAYAVFEDFQLANFGNRIPSLTFEIFERETAVPMAEIARIVSGGCVIGDSAVTLGGAAMQGTSSRAALQPLLAAFPLLVRTAADRLQLADWNSTAVVHPLADAALLDGTERLDRPTRSRNARSQAPSSLSIRHYEPERDFQAGVQTSRRMGVAQNDVQIDLPAAVSASLARGLANGNLQQLWRGLNLITAALPLGSQSIRTGDVFTTGIQHPPMRITEVEYLRGTTRITASEWAQDATPVTATDPGRVLPVVDVAAGQTQMIVADIPAMTTTDPERPIVVVAAAGTSPGWRRASIALLDGDREVELGGTNGIATIGHSVDSLLPHSPLLIDESSQPVIRLLHSGLSLPPGSGIASAFDAPALWIGGEIIRYGSAEKIGAQDYRLSGLLRGCFGTDSSTTHNGLTPCFLLDPASMLTLDTVPLALDAPVTLHANGIGDSVAVSATTMVKGAAIRPPAPVHGRVHFNPDGGLSLLWNRRDRLPHSWADGVDMPNSESIENYRVAFYADTNLLLERSGTGPFINLTATEWSALQGGISAALSAQITQQGRFAASRPLVVPIMP
jgi:hypothetical protein